MWSSHPNAVQSNLSLIHCVQVFKTDVEFELLFELTTKLLDVFMANPELQLLLTSYCHTR